MFYPGWAWPKEGVIFTFQERSGSYTGYKKNPEFSKVQFSITSDFWLTSFQMWWPALHKIPIFSGNSNAKSKNVSKYRPSHEDRQTNLKMNVPKNTTSLVEVALIMLLCSTCQDRTNLAKKIRKFLQLRYKGPYAFWCQMTLKEMSEANLTSPKIPVSCQLKSDPIKRFIAHNFL